MLREFAETFGNGLKIINLNHYAIDESFKIKNGKKNYYHITIYNIY